MEPSASFGNWVTQRRAALHLTRPQLALYVACATITLRKIEEDARRPSPELARKLAEHLAIEPAERERFIQVARGERSVAWLRPPGQVAPSATQSTQLPLPLTSLIGRADELADLTTLFAHAAVRLLTLTGPGGSGKTRLALQLAHDLAGRYTDGATFIDLAPLTAMDQVLVMIAQALGVKELVGTALVARVREHLLPRQILLVLDNFEHLVAAAPLIADLLMAAPGLAVLVTSRIRLNISGEREYPVAPLSESAAISLFAERAQAARPTFALTEADIPTVAALCRQLDCLPLALELAAARIRLFTPHDLLAHLQQNGRLSLLSTGMRDRLPRQQTIRATIAWSYHMLRPTEQVIFRRLAIFVDGWTFAAAAVICNLGGDFAAGFIDQLQALADHSLIRLELDKDGAPRIRQLETIREYASELLATSGERALLQHQHAVFFCELAESVANADQPGEARWHRQVAADYGNIQAALAWGARPAGDPKIALRLAVALRGFWFTQDRPLSEGVHWLETTLAAAELPDNDRLRARALDAAGHLVLISGQVRRAEPLLTEALAIYTALGDDQGCARVLYFLGIQKQLIGDLAQACTLQEASFERATRLQDLRGVSSALSALGRTHVFQGAYDRAAQVLATCLATKAQLNAPEAERAHIRALLADALMQGGDDADALTLLEQAIPILRREDGAHVICTALFARARIAREQADDDLAEALLQESLTLAHHQGLAYSLANTHFERAMLALARDNLAQASWEIQQSLSAFRVLENPWFVGVALLGAGLTELLSGDFAAAARDYTESITLLQAWHENPPARAAGLLAGLAGLLCASEPGSADQAIQALEIWALIAASESCINQRITPPFLHLPRPSPTLCHTAIGKVHTFLDPDAFDIAWANGQRLVLEQALASALTLITIPAPSLV